MTRWFQVRRFAPFVAALALLAMPPSVDSVAAWCNAGVTKWNSPTQQLYVYYTVPAGWNAAISASRADWNGIDTLNYITPIFSSHITTNFNLFYSDFSNLGWDPIPAQTFNNNGGNPHSTSNVYLNSDYVWNLNGVMDQSALKADVRTVATHELGHSSGLHHPNVCGAMDGDEIAAVMWPNWTKKWATNVDDDNGIRAIYP